MWPSDSAEDLETALERGIAVALPLAAGQRTVELTAPRYRSSFYVQALRIAADSEPTNRLRIDVR